MKRSRFSEEQIIAILKQHESGVSTAGRLSRARDQFGDILQVEGQVRRHGCFGRPEAEGARGRKRQAEEIASRTDARQRNAQGCRLAKVVTPAAKRGAVAHLCKAHEVSQRRACSVLDVDRSSMRYRSVRADDGDLRKAMKEVADERRRFGYRRVHLMLERQGWLVNQKKLRRLYAEEKLQVKRRGGRKRALATRRPEPPQKSWSTVIDRKTEDQRWRTSEPSRKRSSASFGKLRFLSAKGCRERMRSGRSV